MKLKKALCLLLGIALLLSIGMPGILAMEVSGDELQGTTGITGSDEAPTGTNSTEPENHIASFGSGAVGDTIWIRSGSQTYTQPDAVSASHEVLFDYETTVLNVVTDADGNLWYEFEPADSLQDFSDYRYVQVESTRGDEPAESDEADNGYDCTCGENAPENLANHADACPRKQAVLSLIEEETGGYQTAAQIYAHWESYDEATRTDILNMVQAYIITEYDALVKLIEGSTTEADPGEVAISELSRLEEAYASVTEDTCETFYEDMMAAYSKAFENDAVVVSTEQLRVIDAKFSARQDALYNDFGYTHVQSLAAQPAWVNDYDISMNSDDETSGVILDKKVSVGQEGVSDFLLTLESYVTGTSWDYTIPVDLILVLDQSASMYAPMGLTAGCDNKSLFLGNSENLTRYALDAGETSAVSGCKDLKAALNSTAVDSTGLTFKEKCAQLGYLVAQSRSGGSAYCTKDHGEGGKHEDTCKTNDWFVVQYVEDDVEGKVWHFHRIEHTACPSTDKWHNKSYQDDCVKFTEAQMGNSHFYFYKSQTGALYDSITSFAKVLKDSGGDHRLAIAGFSGYDIAGDGGNNPNNPGTGIYIDGNKIAYDSTYAKQDSIYYSTITTAQYASALMSVQTNFTGIQRSLAAVKTDFYGTSHDVGFDMALHIIKNAPKVEEDLAGYDRQKIVVLFTDGEPSGPKTGDIVAKAKELKDAGASVYTICTSTLGADKRAFLTASSSDYPYATGTYGADSYDLGSQISNPKFAKTAENSDQLVNQFISIAEDVGGADIELGTEAVLLDALTQYFTLPDELIKTIGADGKPDAETLKKYIQVYTADYDGSSFGKETLFEDAEVEISKGEDGRYSIIRVTNFDYSGNFVSVNGRGENNGFHGRKLIVKIAINSDSEFVGGNNVSTNASSSGIYDDEGKPVAAFPVPKANVQIEQAESEIVSNVYLGAYYSTTVTSDQIKANTEITIGGVTLDLSKEDYGLEDWQKEYTDIKVTITDENGNIFTSKELDADMKYTVTVTITLGNQPAVILSARRIKRQARRVR